MLLFKIKIPKSIIFLFRTFVAPSSGRGDKKISVFTKQKVKTAFCLSKWRKKRFFDFISKLILKMSFIEGLYFKLTKNFKL
jgi:hypothetical protein